MKDFDGLILFVFTAAVICALFLGLRNFLKKSIQSTPKVNTLNDTTLIDQRKRMDNDKKELERTMRENKQILNDYKKESLLQRSIQSNLKVDTQNDSTLIDQERRLDQNQKDYERTMRENKKKLNEYKRMQKH